MTQDANQVQEVLIDNLRVFVVPVDILHVPNLTTNEKMAYMVIRSFCNPQGENAFPSYNTIARLASYSRSTAIRAVAGLLEKGLLQKEIRLDVSKNRKIRNTSNLYKLEHPAKAVKTGVVSHRHQPSVTQTPPPVSEGHHPQCQSDTLTKSVRTKSVRTKSPKSVSKPTQQPAETFVDTSKLPRLTDRMIQLHFSNELIVKMIAFASELQLTDEQAMTALDMSIQSAKKDKLHYWAYISKVYREKANIAKAGALLDKAHRAGQKRAVMEDELPLAVRRQKEREADEERLRAAGVEIEPQKGRKLADIPELAQYLTPVAIPKCEDDEKPF